MYLLQKTRVLKINGYLISPLLGFILSFFVDLLVRNNVWLLIGSVVHHLFSQCNVQNSMLEGITCIYNLTGWL